MGYTTQASQPHHQFGPSIIDIRQEALTPLADQISSGLRPKDGGEKTLPTLLLYNEEGLKLFEKITYLEEYYLTGQEIAVLEQYADRIADRIALQPGSIVVELGSGYVIKSASVSTIPSWARTDRVAAIFVKSRSFWMHWIAKAMIFLTMLWTFHK